jgi:iron complex outermembrane recepter protein
MRVRTTRRWLWIMPVAIAAQCGLLLMSAAHGQEQKGEKQDDKKPPTVPPTKVEATPIPPTLAPPIEQPAPPTPASNPITNGGVFGSPAVQGYKADSATSGTKVNTPLIDYPGAISVIPLDLLKDQSVLRVDDLLRNVPSAVKILSDPASGRDDFALRGFEIGSRDVRWNGFTDPGLVTRDFANIQRVEVLSGPASVLYGSGSPSGLINFITKKPLDTSYNNFQFTTGSYNLQRYAIDSTGPLDEEGRFLYRINAAYQTNDSFRDFGWEQRTFIAPAFTYRISEDTSLSFDSSYTNDRKHQDTGLIFQNGAIIGPINRSLNEPTDWQHFQDYKAAVFLNHRFDDNWSARVGFFTNAYINPSYGTMPLSGGSAIAQGFGVPLGPTQILRQTNSVFDFGEQFYDAIAEVNGKFGSLFKHNVVLGTEVGWYHSNFNGATSDPLVPVPAIFDYANPVYGTVNNPALPGGFSANIMQERYGFYASDMIELNEHWKLLAGVRYDVVDTTASNSFNEVVGGFSVAGFPVIANDRTDYHISPRVGLIYQPIPETLSLYAAFAQSFDPPVTGIFASPTPLKPETGTMGEIGAKWDVIDKRLSLMAAGYIIDKKNVVAQESFITSTQIGEIRSTGAELSAVGKITREWSVVANYAYTSSIIVGNSGPGQIGNVGDRFRGIPYNNANLWTRYNLIDTDKQTFGIGLGIVYVGERFGDLDNTFSLPGFTRWDAGVFYKRNRLNASLYFENIFNRTYYSGSYDANTIFPGMPFNVRATMGITF